MASLFFLAPFFHAQSLLSLNLGAPLANGNIYTYQAQTLNAFPTFTDNTGSVMNPNPIQLDADGRLSQEIWLSFGQPYKFIITDSSNTQIGPTLDNVSGINDTSQTIGSNIIVINSVTSSDTSNAASANSAKQAFNQAGIAYGQANAAYTAANNAANNANSGINFLSNNTIVFNGKSLNFNNSSAANIQVTASNTGVDVILVANGVTSNASSNGHTTLPGGLILQWFTGTQATSGGQGPFTTPFPLPFPTACFVCVGNNSGAGPLDINSVDTSNVTWFTDFGASGIPAGAHQSFIAIGN